MHDTGEVVGKIERGGGGASIELRGERQDILPQNCQVVVAVRPLHFVVDAECMHELVNGNSKLKDEKSA